MPPDRQCQIEVYHILYCKGLYCTSIVSCSFEHDTDDSTIWLVSTLILRVNTQAEDFLIHQPHERTCSLTAV
ncbi:hypothetical protein TNCV_4520241 [Trichonephila clavipes]|nr:hypothetical protein TNCV_4520241 [Trichonephila clavipes]